jgi:hypothetical protein
LLVLPPSVLSDRLCSCSVPVLFCSVVAPFVSLYLLLLATLLSLAPLLVFLLPSYPP